MGTETVTTIRAPAWLRGLYGATGLLLMLIILFAILIVGGSAGVTVGLLAAVLLLVIAPVVIASWRRRLEVSDDRLVLVQAIGRIESPIRDIAEMRLYRIGNGLSRCTFIKVGGSQLGKARGVWQTGDLLRVADAIGVRVEDVTPISRGHHQR